MYGSVSSSVSERGVAESGVSSTTGSAAVSAAAGAGGAGAGAGATSRELDAAVPRGALLDTSAHRARTDLARHRHHAPHSTPHSPHSLSNASSVSTPPHTPRQRRAYTCKS